MHYEYCAIFRKHTQLIDIHYFILITLSFGLGVILIFGKVYKKQKIPSAHAKGINLHFQFLS